VYFLNILYKGFPCINILTGCNAFQERLNETEEYNTAFMALERDDCCRNKAVGADYSDASKVGQTRGMT
jgi:hypothetical protein